MYEQPDKEIIGDSVEKIKKLLSRLFQVRLINLFYNFELYIFIYTLLQKDFNIRFPT